MKSCYCGHCLLTLTLQKNRTLISLHVTRISFSCVKFNVSLRQTMFYRLNEAQLSVRRITGEKKVETRKINPNSLVRLGLAQSSWTVCVCVLADIKPEFGLCFHLCLDRKNDCVRRKPTCLHLPNQWGSDTRGTKPKTNCHIFDLCSRSAADNVSEFKSIREEKLERCWCLCIDPVRTEKINDQKIWFHRLESFIIYKQL